VGLEAGSALSRRPQVLRQVLVGCRLLVVAVERISVLFQPLVVLEVEVLVTRALLPVLPEPQIKALPVGMGVAVTVAAAVVLVHQASQRCRVVLALHRL
jgi:hypothetical protein